MNIIYEAAQPAEVINGEDGIKVVVGRATFFLPLIFEGVVEDGKRYTAQLVEVDTGEEM